MPSVISIALRSVPLVCVALLAACGSVGSVLPSQQALSEAVSPYKIDILQGNVVTREQVQVLRPGLTRNQVRDVLGSPLLTSVFHADRWDYVFTLQRQGAPSQSRKVTVFFRDDVLQRIEADELPSENEFVSTLRVPVPTGPKPVLEAPATDGPVVAKPKVVAPVAPTAPVDTSSYPPLEAPSR